MSQEIAQRWTGRAAVRQHVTELGTVYRRAEVAEAELSAVSSATKRAVFEAMSLTLLRNQAELLAPDGAEHYAHLALVGITEMAQVIGQMRRQMP